MLKRGIIGMVVGIALTGAVLAVTASGSTRSHSAGHVRLHLIEHPVNEHVIDLPPTGVDSQGDQFPFSNLLFDRSNRHQVGRDQNCEISVEGAFYDRRDSVLAIIGGTGQYRDARGQMLLHARADGYDFVFSIDR